MGDVSDRKHAEKASLQIARKVQGLSEQREDHLRLVINTIPTTAWSLLPDGALDFVNRRWLDYTGLSLEEALAEPTRIVHPEDLPNAVERWSVVMAAGQAHETEVRLRRADGEYRWFLVRVVPLRNEQGTIVKWYGTSTDIEDRKRAEERSRQAAEELQALSRRLVEVQESERKELARELHDRIGQNLTALNINLHILGTALPLRGGDEPRSRLADSRALVESTTEAIGNILSELRPPMLDQHGLALALDWYARQVSARIRVAVTVRNPGPGERLAPEVEIALFRIAQEALNNVAKHARAKRVVITLRRTGSEQVMSIVDDGIGLRAMQERLGRPVLGLGIVTMRERAQAVGGQFAIEGIPGGGTRLTVRVAG